MEYKWDNIDYRKDLAIKGLLYGSFFCFFFGIIFGLMYRVNPDDSIYKTLCTVFFILSAVLFVLGSATVIVTGADLNKDPVHNAAISLDTEMSTVSNEARLFHRRQNTVEGPNVQPTSGRSSSSSLSFYSRIWSSYLRERLWVTGIPRESDRVSGRWTEPDTPVPDSNLRRSEDREEESERNFFEEAFPEEQIQSGECVLQQRF